MTSFILIRGLALLCITALFTGCGEESATGPDTGAVTDWEAAYERSDVFTQGFEGDNLEDMEFFWYKLSPSASSLTALQTTDIAANTGAYSVKSLQNGSGMKRSFAPKDYGIVVFEFHMMADAAKQTNLVAFMGQDGASSQGTLCTMGMGFDKSGQIKIIYGDQPNQQIAENVAPFEPGKWYKAKSVFDLDSLTARFYLDGVQVSTTKSLPNVLQLNMIVMQRDTLGLDGPANYLLDDFSVYTLGPKQ